MYTLKHAVEVMNGKCEVVRLSVESDSLRFVVNSDEGFAIIREYGICKPDAFVYVKAIDEKDIVINATDEDAVACFMGMLAGVNDVHTG